MADPILFPLLAAALAGGQILAQPLPPLIPTRHKMRVPVLPGIPTYDYQWPGAPSRTEAAASLPAVEVLLDRRGVADPLSNRGRIRTFKLSVPGIQINHCSLSDFSLVLYADGRWSLSARADQNPWAAGQPDNVVSGPAELPVSIRKETMSLKRNLFRVRVRCRGGAAVGASPLLAGPVFLELCPPLFWVQRGVPYRVRAESFDPAIARTFDLIDAVEVELMYR